MGEKINIKVSKLKNPVQNYNRVLKDLNRISEEQKIPINDLIDMFIEDLKNTYSEGYEKKVKGINIDGEISTNIISTLSIYLNRARKMYREREKREKREAKKTVKEAEEQKLKEAWEDIKSAIESSFCNKDLTSKIQKAEELLVDKIKDLDEKQRKYMEMQFKKWKEREIKTEEDKKSKIQKALDKINEVVEKEVSKTGISKLQCLKGIRAKLKGEDENSFNIKVSKSIEEEITTLMDQKIAEEQDLVYYEQVKKFTRDFSFFSESPEIITATTGKRSQLFTDRESYYRFYNLRELIREGRNEYKQITKVLKDNDLSEMDKRILNERIKRIEEKRKEENIHSEK